MLCENCGKREANVRYSENINGVKKEMHLCEECSQKLGISSKMDFSMPSLDIPSFFGSFLEDFSTPEFMPLLNEVKHQMEQDKQHNLLYLLLYNFLFQLIFL